MMFMLSFCEAPTNPQYLIKPTEGARICIFKMIDRTDTKSWTHCGFEFKGR